MNEEITRFDLDMDGSMEPSEHGRWVRYQDIAQPKKEWVGLTEKQKLSLEIQGNKSDVLLAELVEQWLKENNNA